MLDGCARHVREEHKIRNTWRYNRIINIHDYVCKPINAAALALRITQGKRWCAVNQTKLTCHYEQAESSPLLCNSISRLLCLHMA